MFFTNQFTANAACPQRPSWNISEVGYAWAQAVAGFHRTRNKLFQKKKKTVQMSAQEEAFRFELHKPYEKGGIRTIGGNRKQAVALCKSHGSQDCKELSA